jgi:hypothetical protein
MPESLYPPIPTDEIPMPIVAAAGPGPEGQEPLPRVLQQVAEAATASRRTLALAALFVVVSAGLAALLLEMPAPEPLLVYGEYRRMILLEFTK